MTIIPETMEGDRIVARLASSSHKVAKTEYFAPYSRVRWKDIGVRVRMHPRIRDAILSTNAHIVPYIFPVAEGPGEFEHLCAKTKLPNTRIAEILRAQNVHCVKTTVIRWRNGLVKVKPKALWVMRWYCATHAF